jgi:N-acetylated-alpha-linked acidic dipeptidase
MQLQQIAHPDAKEDREEARTRPDLRIGALGGGSDYGPFLNIIGIASLDIGFSGETGGGIYHSIYDDFYWYTHFADTDFSYGRALSDAGGIATMRLADADLLPFDFSDYADTLQMYVRELKKFAKDQQEEIKERNLKIEEGAFTASADPKEKYVAPKKEPVPPYLNFAPLENAVESIMRSAQEYSKALTKANEHGGAALAGSSSGEINRMLIQSERKLTTPQGIPGRQGYHHELYAPGEYTGYEAKAIPAVREAMEQKHWKLAEDGILRVANLLSDEAALISSAAEKLSSAK